MSATGRVMLDPPLFDLLLHDIVHLAFAWKKRVGRLTTLLFVLRPPAVAPLLIRCPVRAMSQPREGAGNHHRIDRVMTQIAAVLFLHLLLLRFRQILPAFAGG